MDMKAAGTSSAWTAFAGATREEMAHRKLATALARVRAAEQEAEHALADLEAAVREQHDVNGITVTPDLTVGFQSMWEERRIRLMVEQH